MITHDFVLCGSDTDSILFCKPNGKPFSEEEQQQLLDEVNSLFPENIKFAHDGYYKSVVYIKAKNYCLYDGKKLKYKGSALKCPMKELALKEFSNSVLDLLLNKKKDQILFLYAKYAKEIKNITDISRWSHKKTITKSVLKPKRKNESNVLDAMEGEEYSEGDKVLLYFKKGGILKLSYKFEQDHDEDRLFKKLYKTLNVFSTVLDPGMIPDFSLKKNRELLEEL